MIKTFMWALIVRYLALLFLFVGVLLPVRVAVMRFMPPCRLKRWLLTPVGYGYGRTERFTDSRRIDLF